MSTPDLVAIAQNLPPEFWATMLGATGITLFVEKIKGWLEREQEKRPWIYLLISTTLAFLAALGHYVANGGGQEWTVLGQHTATVLGVIQVIYRFPKVGVKALHETVNDAKEYRASQKASSSSTPTDTSPATTETLLTPATVPATAAGTVLEDEL